MENEEGRINKFFRPKKMNGSYRPERSQLSSDLSEVLEIPGIRVSLEILRFQAARIRDRIKSQSQ